jgi:5-(carboxyamino)imidazole ribonucleotide mutase
MVQMPKGIPVSTLAIGEAGAANADPSVVAILALHGPAIKAKLIKYRADQAEKVRNSTLPELL